MALCQSHRPSSALPACILLNLDTDYCAGGKILIHCYNRWAAIRPDPAPPHSDTASDRTHPVTGRVDCSLATPSEPF
nr:hypothetical protein JVH1_0895 [Rhodococcus sp. JVH1]